MIFLVPSYYLTTNFAWIWVSRGVIDTQYVIIDMYVYRETNNTRLRIYKCSVKQFQRAKKVMSDSSGLVDFAIGLVNSVFNRQVMLFEELEQEKCDINSARLG